MRRDCTIALFSVSAGAGHVRAAEAIGETARLKFPGVTIVHLDVMDLVPPWFKKVYADSYTPLVERHRALWGYLYEKTDQRKIDSNADRFRVALENLNTKMFRSAVEEIAPDHVVCTHFLPAEILSGWRRKKKFLKPVWVVVTDFDVHMLWVHRHLSGYCTASEEVAWRLHDRGVERHRIHVTGIPVMPAFGQRHSRTRCAREFGIDLGKTTLLLMAGGSGVGEIDRLARCLLGLPQDFQLLAGAGRSKRLLNVLQDLARGFPGRLFPLGFTNNVDRLMAISDLAISKPGGLTSSECLAMGLPMIVVSPIPGQEERNADYLLEHGAALKAYDEAGLEFRVSMLLRDPRRLERMRRNAQRIGSPKAAENVLNTVLRAAGASASP